LKKKIIKNRLNDSKGYPGYPAEVQAEVAGRAWKFKVIKVTSGHVHLFNDQFDSHFSVPKVLSGYSDEEKRLLRKLKPEQIITANISLELQKDERWDYVVTPIDNSIPKKVTGKLPTSVIKKLDCLCKEDKAGKLYRDAEKYFANIKYKIHLNVSQREFAKKAYDAVLQARNETQQQRTPVDNTSPLEKRMVGVDTLKSEVEEKEKAIVTVDDVKALYRLYRKLEQEQFDWCPDRNSIPENELLFDETTFNGTIEYKGAGIGLVNCRYFKYPLVLYPEDLEEGVIKKSAGVSFQVQKDSNSDLQKQDPAKRIRLKCLNTHSDNEKEEFRPCITCVTDSISQKIRSKIAKTSKEQPVLVVCNPHNYPHVNSILMDQFIGDSVFVGKKIFEIAESFVYEDLLKNCILVCGNKSSFDNGYRKKVRKTLYAHLADKIAEKEKDSWVVVMDETGACRDHQPMSNPQKSVMMALIIPPGISLGPCPLNYHSIESDPDITRDIRNRIVETQGVVTLVFPYHEADPYDPTGRGTELHGQMWRHTVPLCLEYIAQKNKKKAAVRFYIEEYGANPQWSPGSNAFEEYANAVLEPMQGRDGWNDLSVFPPKIVAKNVHPWLGYVDSLGHAYRTQDHRCTQEDLELFQKINEAGNTIMLPYNQKALEQVETIIKLSGNNPENALMQLSNTEEKVYVDFQKILKPLAKICLDSLSTYQLTTIVNHLGENLSKRPVFYHASSEIADLIGDSNDPVIREVQQINQLMTCNRRGDTTQGNRIVETVRLRLPDLSKSIRYRFLANMEDHYQNSFNFEQAETDAVQYLKGAESDMDDMTSACHFLGSRMQTFAHDGKTEEALAYWQKLLPKQVTSPDVLRYYTYGISLYHDLNQLDAAVKLAQNICDTIGFSSLAHAAVESSYLAATLLKLEFYKPFLADDDRSFLFDKLHTSEGHPGQLINFWRLMILKNEGSDYTSQLEPLLEQLKQEQPCEALWLIMSCIGEQLVRDEVIDKESLRYAFDGLVNQSNAVKKRLNKFPVDSKELVPCLTPLRFNFR